MQTSVLPLRMQMTEQVQRSTVFEKLQPSTEELQVAFSKLCMKINFSKCKVITPIEKCIVFGRQRTRACGTIIFLVWHNAVYRGRLQITVLQVDRLAQ